MSPLAVHVNDSCPHAIAGREAAEAASTLSSSARCNLARDPPLPAAAVLTSPR